MPERVRVALTVAVLGLEFAILLNAVTHGRAGDWTVRQVRRARWRIQAPFLAEANTKRAASHVIFEAIELTREAADDGSR